MIHGTGYPPYNLVSKLLIGAWYWVPPLESDIKVVDWYLVPGTLPEFHIKVDGWYLYWVPPVDSHINVVDWYMVPGTPIRVSYKCTLVPGIVYLSH